MGSSAGASLTFVTVTRKARLTVSSPPLFVPPSSVTVTVMRAVPQALGDEANVIRPVLAGLV